MQTPIVVCPAGTQPARPKRSSILSINHLRVLGAFYGNCRRTTTLRTAPCRVTPMMTERLCARYGEFCQICDELGITGKTCGAWGNSPQRAQSTQRPEGRWCSFFTELTITRRAAQPSTRAASLPRPPRLANTRPAADARARCDRGCCRRGHRPQSGSPTPARPRSYRWCRS